MTRIAALDGLRGLAILLVIAFHAGWMTGGAHGVTLFFVLSGFVITRLLVAELDSGAFSLRRFYWNRMVRLAPALLLLIIVVALFLGGTDWVWSLAYVANYAGIAGAPLQGFVHTWSLAVEEHFYLLWPIALILISSRRRQWWVAGLLAAAVVWRLALLLGGADYTWIYVSTDTSAYALLAGCFLAVVGWRPSKTLTIAAIIGLLLLLWNSPYHRTYGFLWIGFPVVALSAVAVAGCAAHRIRWLEVRWLTWLGVISYGLYLWHFPLLGIGLPKLVALGLTLAVAVLSWRVVEQPLQQRFRMDRLVQDDRHRIGDATPDEHVESHKSVVSHGQPLSRQTGTKSGSLFSIRPPRSPYSGRA